MTTGFYYLYAKQETDVSFDKDGWSTTEYVRTQIAVFSSEEKAEQYVESCKVAKDAYFGHYKTHSLLYGCVWGSTEIVFLPLDPVPCD